MYKLNIFSNFSAAHKLIDYEGDCANLHGHNWKVRLEIICKKTDSIGLTIDFKILKKKFNKILAKFDHKNLNELEYFKDKNPTSENIAKLLYRKVLVDFSDSNCKVNEIEIWESEKYSIIYKPDENN
ncbi:MAG: 6-carboxytetrahydropterin synthase QueD [Candidatus Cloacimonetes bacterium]|nr:6-carboxytetrahydropterin synthase QueD [Candidatus Cloacimonadota bacterium]MBL7107804.1 6-carboxytetrahydropterin synthase QueD [Candidatus Cloacimonadota bacterium]